MKSAIDQHGFSPSSNIPRSLLACATKTRTPYPNQYVYKEEIHYH